MYQALSGRDHHQETQPAYNGLPLQSRSNDRTYYYEGKGLSIQQINGHEKGVLERKARDLRITAFAVFLIGVLLFALCFALLGVGILPPTSIFGLGMVSTLGGFFFGMVGGLLVCGAAVTGVVSYIQSRRASAIEDVR